MICVRWILLNPEILKSQHKNFIYVFNVLIMVWGVNKFGKKLVRPDTVTNNEMLVNLTTNILFRVLIMVWGVNKFGKKLVRPDTVTNNELMDFLSRVPSDEDLLDARYIYHVRPIKL